MRRLQQRCPVVFCWEFTDAQTFVAGSIVIMVHTLSNAKDIYCQSFKNISVVGSIDGVSLTWSVCLLLFGGYMSIGPSSLGPRVVFTCRCFVSRNKIISKTWHNLNTFCRLRSFVVWKLRFCDISLSLTITVQRITQMSYHFIHVTVWWRCRTEIKEVPFAVCLKYLQSP